MKNIYFDLETTGVKFWKNGIHQISMIVEIDGLVKETCNWKVKPFKDAVVETEALAVGGLVPADLLTDTYKPMAEVYREMISILAKYVDKFNSKDKFFLIGYNNASFDNAFLRAWFVQNGDNYFGSWFWANPIDVYVMASYLTMDVRAGMINGKLMTMAKWFEISIDESKLHDALYDVTITRELFMKVKLKR